MPTCILSNSATSVRTSWRAHRDPGDRCGHRWAVLVLLVHWGITCAPAQIPLRTAERMALGEPVTLVAFGDSITGAYYHSGGRRAWSDLLHAALLRIYPRAQITMVNAGVSGNTTAAALARMEPDVLRHRPDLVLVMFGMNDVTSGAPEPFRDRLSQIIQRTRAAGGEVVLLTPNSIYPDDPRRNPGTLAAFAEVVRQVGRELGVPVADCHRVFQQIEAVDRRAWVRLMSDAIHPNLRGHAVIAEEAARILSGHDVPVFDLPAPPRRLEHVRTRLGAEPPLRVLAMKPGDELARAAFTAVAPAMSVDITSWDVGGKPLASIEAEAKERGWWRFRSEPGAARPDLVIIAVPAGALAPSGDQFYRSYTWVLNWSQSLGRSARERGWDTLVVLPSVFSPKIGPAARVAEKLALEVVHGIDLPFVIRSPGDMRPAAELLTEAMKSLLAAPER